MSDNCRPSKRAKMEVLARSAAAVFAPLLTPLAHLPLTSLPLAVLEHLLLFLTVSSLQRLAATCSFLEQLIHGRFITTLEFPFAPAFLQELAAATSIDKKPVLRLICHQVKLTLLSPTGMAMGLAFTSLDRLRDLVLHPDPTTISTYKWRTKFESSCTDLLEELGRRGGLRRLTQLAIPVRAAARYLRRPLMPHPTKLLSLHLIACTKDDLFAVLGMCGFAVLGMCGFGRPIKLVITVMPHVTVARKMKVEASALSSFPDIEKLEIVGPCSLDFHLESPRLREVATAAWATTCTHTRLPAGDRRIHRSGSCGMDVRWAWGKCPLLTSYNGVTLEAQGREERDEQGRLHVVRNDFGEDRKKWMAAAKAAFYSDYRSKGGEKELKAWAKARWSGGKL